MRKLFLKLPPKLRIFLPIFFSVIIPVLLITIYSINRSRIINEKAIQNNLELQVQTIKKMFEREHDLKLSKVKNDLKIVHDKFYDLDFNIEDSLIKIIVVNQITDEQHSVSINNWKLNGRRILSDQKFISEIHELVGGTTTIFQKIDLGYLRISTNVLTSEGAPAVGSFIPNSSDVVKTIETGKDYFGRAYVVNGWYITAYEPLYYEDKLVGMLYAGDKEKDLDELQSKLSTIKIGTSGYLMVVDETNEVVISSKEEIDQNIKDYISKNISTSNKGSFYLPNEISKEKILVSFERFDGFKLNIVAIVSIKEESKEIVSGLVKNSSIIALIIILIFSVFVYFIKADNVRTFYEQLEKSSKNLNVVKKALRESRHDFRTLFNSSSDDILVTDFEGKIIEANKVVCETFKLQREDIIGKNIQQFLTENFKGLIKDNLERASRFGKITYESEYQVSDQKKLSVEMKSRAIEYRGKQAILTIIRDISERKEMEEKMISTIIQTEENERKRFSADLHDDLGPILSTIKLYAGLIRKNQQKQTNNEETIQSIEELVDNAIQTTRNISRNIRPNILQDFGLAAAIQEFCAYIIKTKSININLTTQNYKIEKRGIEETILYHTAKELINNTLRYANAQNIKLDLKSFNDQVILYYRDDGIGFDLEVIKKVPKGLGLNNIVNKIKSIKGSVDLHSEPGKGMFLIASVKINQDR